MSVRKAKEFLTKLSESEDTAARAEEQYVSGLMKLAAELGFEFSADDLRQAMYEVESRGKALRDLDPPDASGVVGGRGFRRPIAVDPVG